MEKKGAKMCNFCGEEISESKRFVLIGTYEKNDKIDFQEEKFYHIDCFVKWYNSQVEKKAKGIVLQARDKAVGLLKGVLGGGNSEVEVLRSYSQTLIKDELDEIKEMDLGGGGNITKLKKKKEKGKRNG